MSPATITKIVSDIFGVDVSEIRQQTHLDRADRVVFARFAAITLCRQKTTMSLSQLGRFFRNKNHSTVINAMKVCSYLCETNRAYAALFDTTLHAVNSSEIDVLQLTGFYPFVYDLTTIHDD